MATFTLGPAPGVPVSQVRRRYDAPPKSEVELAQRIRDEVNEYLGDMQTFAGAEPDMVMMSLSAICARATELRIHLSRSESRLAQKLRVSEIEPLIEECERQYRLHSRIQTIREFDLKLSGGQT